MTKGKAHSLSSIKYSSSKNHSNRLIGIVTGSWNQEITSVLLQGCKKILKKAGVKPGGMIEASVPGSFELAFGAQALIDKILVTKNRLPDAVICLGCVIQGETRHFEFISQATANGIMQVGLDTGIPVIFGVLTTDNRLQAKERAGGKLGNKGEEAALAALQMIDEFGSE